MDAGRERMAGAAVWSAAMERGEKTGGVAGAGDAAKSVAQQGEERGPSHY
jgi:hypothetical protein